MRPASALSPRQWITTALLLLVLECAGSVRAEDKTPLGQSVPPASGPTFTVASVRPGTDLTLVAYGDCRFTSPSNTKDTNPRVRKFLVDQIAAVKPNAIFITGDLPFNGSNPDDWAVFRSETAAWRTEGLRLYPTLGNHEVRGDWDLGLQNYFANFPQLQGYAYYSVQLGNVYLLTLDSTQRIGPGTPQRGWLESQLAHVPPAADFIFVMEHMPLMADLQSQVLVSLPNFEGTLLRKYLESLAPRLKQKLVVLNGHIHNYERFEQAGVTYLVSGGGGADPYPVMVRGNQDKYRDPALINYHYLVIRVHGTHGDVTMYRVADPAAPVLTVEPKDRFTIDANRP